MDNLTHSLVGAVLGQAGLKRKTGLAMPALIIGANLPDVDAACFLWLDGVEHLGFRRGITHGPPALVLLPLILAGLLWGFDRWQASRGKRPEKRLPVHFGWLYALSFIGCLSHPALDWLNVYGIRLLEPFSSQWFYGDTLFIIDVWLWGLLIIAVIWAWHREIGGGDQRQIARGAIVVMLVYIAMNGAITAFSKPVHFLGARGISAPVPLTFWEREFIVGGDGYWLIATKEPQTLEVQNGEPVVLPVSFEPIAFEFCVLPEFDEERRSDSQLEAFLFWSRAPFAERAEDGSVILRDARFYDPRARDRFSLALPDVRCVELPAD